jgi:hypothetical protein
MSRQRRVRTEEEEHQEGGEEGVEWDGIKGEGASQGCVGQ